jgi:signal transduction histidine kinase/DNA-binding NarL/FixJ family response regulator
VGSRPDDPWSDATFHRDSALDAENREARRRHREVVQIPRLRAVGSAWLFLCVCVHNLVLLGHVDLPRVLVFGTIQAIYVAMTTVVLRKRYEPITGPRLGTFFLATDIALFVAAIYVSGGERSWLLPLLCVRVADQVGTSQRRAALFAHLTLALHLSLVLYLAFVEQRALSLGMELTKVALLYVLNLYLMLAAGPAERQRNYALRMQQQTRNLIETLGQQADQLRRERERAEAANRAKSRFLANMSHEIRTPMNGVLGTADVLLELPLEAEQRRMVETIGSSGRALLGIVNDILDMSKIEAGELRLEQTDFEPSEVVLEVVDNLRAQARAKRIELRADLAPEASLAVRGDPLRVRQVLTNLIGNALKFTERGAVTIAVRSPYSDPKAIALRFDVTDTGIGMSDEVIDRLFHPFHQADDSTTRRFGGTGLGLSIAKQLVEMMGSQFEVESELGKGSRFGFLVALPRGTDLPFLRDSRTGVDAVAELRALSPHVLVAEDTPLNRELIERMLVSVGCRVTSVENGRDAVSQLCAQHDFALALIDWHMPELDGLEATRRVRAHEREHGLPRLPILAFTASAFADETERCRAAGMDGVLSKPLTKAQLLSALRRQLLGRASTVEPAPVVRPAGDDRVLRNSQIAELIELDAATPGGFLADLVDGYLKAAPERLSELTEAVRAADAHKLQHLAHRFRGAAANLGVTVMIEPLRELEEMAEHGQLEDADKPLMHARIAHERTLRPLREMLETLRAKHQ